MTGASRGIGPHIARALTARGFNLLLVARSRAELLRVAEDLRSDGSTADIASVDLSRSDAAEQILAAAERGLGRVDVLVNNAAYEPQRRFHALSANEIEAIVRVNLLTPLTLSRLLLPGMLDRGYGSPA